MSWDNWKSNDFPNSARRVFELSEKKEREELAKRQVKEMEQSIEDFKHEQNRLLKLQELEQNVKLEEARSKFEKEKLEFEKLKEKNNWKRSIVTWGINSVAIVVSIIALIVSLT